MFFNAGRMGFRHFKIQVPGPGPGVGGGDTGCFGLTGTDRIVFAFDTYSVPDKPAFSYIYSCSDANDCFQYGMDKPYDSDGPCENSRYEGTIGQPGDTSDIDAFNYCSCTGARAQSLSCWKQKLDIDRKCTPDIPYTGFCNDDLEEESSDWQICGDFPIGSVDTNPDNDQLCDFCNSQESGPSGGSILCGIKQVWSGYCNCTSQVDGDGDYCFDGCDSNVEQQPGCVHCQQSNGLSWFRANEEDTSDCPGATDYFLPEMISGYTGWTDPRDAGANEDIQDFFRGNVCGTPALPGGSNLSIPVSELSPDGSITDTSQIKPQNFMNLSGHNCAYGSNGCLPTGSVFRTMFSYLTVENGNTFCNIFLTPLVASECASAYGMVPDRPGCTFCYPGITFELGPCVHNTQDRDTAGQERLCSSPHLSNMGCANGLARHYAIDDLSSSSASLFILNNEMRKWRRVDNAEIDTCGVNPCGTSSYFLFDGGATPTGGFDGTNCWGYVGELDGYPTKVQDTDLGDPEAPSWKKHSFYEYYFALCDSQPDQFSTPPNTKGGTSDLVAGIQSERMVRANECINRVGRRSETMFDLPLSSVGTARSFFAPWVDDMIHHTATPDVSGRRLGGGGESESDGTYGDRFWGRNISGYDGRAVINHLAMGPYPAYSYYSWFYGPMFDVSETMTKFDSSDAEFGTDYFGANFAAVNTRFEGQWGPNIFGKFLTHPGFLGTPDDTMRNLSANARGYFDSWGAIRLNNFWKTSGSVFTGGTLAKFTDTLSTGIEAFNNPNQNRKNIDLTFLPGGDEELWPPNDMTNGYFIPVAGATASAGPLDHNPHGITAHSSLGWCSAVNRQNSSWLNPRFTVASNWLWPGDRQEYDTTDHRLMLYTATVDTGELLGEEFASDTEEEDFDIRKVYNINVDQYNRGDEDNARFFVDYRGRSRDMPWAQLYTYRLDYNGSPDLPTIGGAGGVGLLVNATNFGYGSDDETRTSPFAPLNRAFNVDYRSVPDGDSNLFRNTNDDENYNRQLDAECFCEDQSGQACFCIECAGVDHEPGVGLNCGGDCNGQSFGGVQCICDLCACWMSLSTLCKREFKIDGVEVTDADMRLKCQCCGGVGSPNPIPDGPDCRDCVTCVGIHGCTYCNNLNGGNDPRCKCFGPGITSACCWSDDDFNTETGDLHESFQFPATYNAYWNEPQWKPNQDGTIFKYTYENDQQNISGFSCAPAMELHMAINRYGNPTNKGGGNAFRRFGAFTNVKQTSNPNQRFEGMDRYRLHMVLPSNPSNTGEFGDIDPERTVMPSPSLLSYYALPIIGGWGYAGPPDMKVNYDTLLQYRGVGCGKGFLYGPFGRDVIWADPTSFDLESKPFKNYDGTSVTGPTRADRNQFVSTVSDFHAQRLMSNGGNITNNKALNDFSETELESILSVEENPGRGELSMGGYTAQNAFSTSTQCGNTAWQRIRASHCLLDISTGAGKSGYTTIPSSYVGCTAYYKSGSAPATNGSDAEAVYQFNGNGWWYRTHEQLRLGINEEGYTSGVGPAGWIRHQNGYFPDYVVGSSALDGDRMYGPGTTTAASTTSLADRLNGTTFDSGHGFLQDVLGNAEVAAATQFGGTITPSAFHALSNNSQLNNGWTACAPSAFNNTLDGLGYQRQFNEGHFPEIESGYYPSTAGLFLDDTKMFDAVFAWETGSTAGVALGGYFKLINQSGVDLTLRVTGGAASAAGSSNSNPINLNIEPFSDSLNTFGETFDLICMTDTDMQRPYMGNCSRMNDHTAGGYKVWPNEFLVNQIVGWAHPNAEG